MPLWDADGEVASFSTCTCILCLDPLRKCGCMCAMRWVHIYAQTQFWDLGERKHCWNCGTEAPCMGAEACEMLCGRTRRQT